MNKCSSSHTDSSHSLTVWQITREVGNGHIAHLGNIGQSNQIAAAFGIKVMLFSLLLTVKYQSASKHSQRSQTVSIDLF